MQLWSSCSVSSHADNTFLQVGAFCSDGERGEEGKGLEGAVRCPWTAKGRGVSSLEDGLSQGHSRVHPSYTSAHPDFTVLSSGAPPTRMAVSA